MIRGYSIVLFLLAFLLLVSFPFSTVAFQHAKHNPAKLRSVFTENASLRSRLGYYHHSGASSFSSLSFSPSSRTADSSVVGKKDNRNERSGALYANVDTGGSSRLMLSFTTQSQALLRSLFRFSGSVPLWQAFGINAVLFSVLRSKLQKMLTPSGLVHALALGTGLWATLGWRGWTLCVVYLFFGQLVTKVRFEDKEKRGIAEKRGGRRGPENVWGSALTGLICAICFAQGDMFLGIKSDLYALGYVASMSTKLADTFASEIGKAYGKTTFLITTLQRVEPGTEGAVSAEGTAAAVLGGLLLSLYGWLGVGLIKSPTAVGISTIAAFFATNVESVLGATLQEKDGLEWMTNEVVNFINTLIGGAVAIYAGGLLL